MTEHEYSKQQDALEAREEHRLDVCEDCEFNSVSLTDSEKYCVYCDCGSFDGRTIEKLCAEAPKNYCDKWHEGDYAYSEFSPEADAKIKELKRDNKGFYVEDLNAYINDVNNFCYRVISTCSGGMINASDKLILTDKAEKLIKRTKKEANNGV